MRHLLFVFCALLLGNGPSLAQTKEHNNLIVLWEHVAPSATSVKPQFRSHLMFDVPPDQARQFFQNLMPSARKYGNADIRFAKSPLCLAQTSPDTKMIDTTGMEISDKLAALKGLNGVFVDFRGALGPRTYAGNYGKTVHAITVKALMAAGIPLLTKDQLETTPGRPKLTFRYSPEVPGCRPWSVSLSLKQTVVLTRDTTVLMETTTWSGSGRQSEADITYDSLDALEDAVAKFTTDFAKANSVSGPNAVADLSADN